MLTSGRFPKAKTNRAMNPESGPPTAEAGRKRLDEVLKAFEPALDRTGDVATSNVFGTVHVNDYVRFQALHTRHHIGQLPKA